MQTMELILIKYVLGFRLQSFLVVFGIYTFNKQKLILKDFLFASILVTLVTFLMKSLPISVGVQTIMNMIFIYILCVIYLKMQPYITIRSTALCIVLILVSEMVVTSTAVMIFGREEFQIIINNDSFRYYIGTLANIVLGIIIVAFYMRLIRKGDYNRSISEQNS